MILQDVYSMASKSRHMLSTTESYWDVEISPVRLYKQRAFTFRCKERAASFVQEMWQCDRAFLSLIGDQSLPSSVALSR